MKKTTVQMAEEFLAYCREASSQDEHLRFWQALRNWSTFSFILGCNDCDALTESAGDFIQAHDTFYQGND